jgi:hypothetical protein
MVEPLEDRTLPSTIQGTLFDDSNNTGTRTSGDAALTGWQVSLTDQFGQLDASTYTDANGAYQFTGLAAGTYTVAVAAQAGWVQTAPAAGTHSVSFSSTGQTATGEDFGYYLGATIKGTVFDDANDSGGRDPGEGGLAGWRVYLDTDHNNQYDPGEPSALTDSNGAYQITGVPAGTYTLLESPRQPGWVQTVPGTGGYSVSYSVSPTTEGQTIAGNDFGNFLNGVGPYGAELQVDGNPNTAYSSPQVAADGVGDFVVAWLVRDSDLHLYAERYNAAGVGQGRFAISPAQGGFQFSPAVAMDPQGDFVVVWGETSRDSNGQPIASSTATYAQRFNAAGVALGGPFEVTSGAGEPAVAMDSAGDFVITWWNTFQGFPGSIYAQRYSAAGVAEGNAFQVNTTPLTQVKTGFANATEQSVAMDPAGAFVITWWNGYVGSDGFIHLDDFAQYYNAQGAAQGGEVTVAADGGGPGVAAMDAQGNFAIGWWSVYGPTSPMDFVQRYGAAGAPQGSPMTVGVGGTSGVGFGGLAMAGDGSFVVVDGANAGQRYAADGTPQGLPFQVNTSPGGPQGPLSVAMDGTGGFVVAWVGTATGADPVRAQQFYGTPVIMIQGSNLAVHGTGGNDTIAINPASVLGAVDVVLNGTDLGNWLVTGTTSLAGRRGNDSITVSATTAGGLAADGQGGTDSYTVNFGQLSGHVNLTDSVATSATDELTVNGVAGTAPNIIDKTTASGSDTVTWTNGSAGSTTETLSYSHIFSQITLNANGYGQNYLNDPGDNTTINGGPGTNTVVITATGGGGVVVNGGAGSNTYIVDLGSLAGPVVINNSNSTATDNLTVNGQAGANTISVSGSQVTEGAQAISFSAPLANLTVNGGPVNNQITVSSLAASVQSLTLGGGGDDTVQVSSQVTVPTVLVGGSGTNTLQSGGTSNVFVEGAGNNVVQAGPGSNLVLEGPGSNTFIDGGGQNTFQANPLAFADSYAANENNPLTVAAPAGLLANDFSANGGPLTAVLVSNPADGALALNPDGSFLYTPAPGFAGTDTFSYQAQGSDGLLSGVATVTINVRAVASQLVITGLPSSVQAQVPQTFTVTAEDSLGRIATDYAGTIHFTTTDGRGVVPGDYTFVGSDGGAHTFSGGLSLYTLGSQAVSVTDTVNNSITATATVTVVPRQVSWINASGGDWDTPSNWSTNSVPGPTDAVTIGIPGQNTFTVTHASGTDSVYSLSVNAGTLILGGQLQLAAGQTFTNSGTVQLAGATVGLNGNAPWTFVNQGALVAVPGGGDEVFASFTNQATGTLHAEAGEPFLALYGGGTVSGQAGTITVTGDPGTQLAFAGLSFDASTSIASASATGSPSVVYFDGSNTVAGSYQAGGTTELRSGTTTFTGSVQMGSLTLDSGSTANLDQGAPLTLTDLTLMNGSTLDMPSAVTVTGAFTTGPNYYSNNNILGGGTLTLEGTGVLNTGSTTGNVLGTLAVAGSVVNTGTLDVAGIVQLAAGQTFTNSGTVQLGGARLGGGAPWTFLNQGALVAVPGGGDAVNAGFVNQATGTVHAEAGAPFLALNGGGTVAGMAGVATVTGDPGTQLYFNGLSFDASTSIAADAVGFNGTNSVAGAYQANTTNLSGGTTTFTGTVTSLGANLSLEGATLNVPAAVTVTGAFSSSGTSSVLGGSTLTLNGPYSVSGSLQVAGSVVFRVTTGLDNGDDSNPTPQSLRAAILASNNTTSAAGPNLIAFNIPTTDPSHDPSTGSFDVLTPAPGLTTIPNLPDVTAPATIDGYTQPGAQVNTLAQGDNAVLKIVLNGGPVYEDGTQQNVGAGPVALNLVGGNSTVRGLVINNLGSQDNNPPGDNYADGILITTDNNVIEGNFIGTDVTGRQAQGNSGTGVHVGSGSYNRIGMLGDGAGDFADRNIISANGLTTNGVSSSVANGDAGIRLDAASNNVVAGNYIGTDASGTQPLGNYIWGVLVEAADTSPNSSGYNQIGGNTPGDVTDGNLISANAYDGIAFGYNETGNTVYGNEIGTDVTGTENLGNGNNGILVVSTQGLALSGNVIAYNGQYGVAVAQAQAGLYFGGSFDFAQSYGIRIEDNSIHDNRALGVDLGGTWDIQSGNPDAPGLFSLETPLPGVLLNDSQGHSGPNNNQNFPVLTSAATSGTDTSITGTFSEAAEPNTTITLDFYASPAADPSGYGQGRTWLGSTTVTTDANGNATFAVKLGTASLGNLVGQWISATATDPGGNTSEFAQSIVDQALAVSAGGPYTSAEGSGVTFTATTFPGTTANPLTYTWTVNGHSVLGDNNGASPTLTLTWPQLVALGIEDGPAAFALQVAVNDGHGLTATSPGTTLTLNDTPVSNLQLALQSASINEGGSVNLSGSFVNPSPIDANTVVINWGDGTTGNPDTTTLNLAAGVTSFSGVTHQYLEESGGQPNGKYPISVAVSDGEGGQASAQTSIQVNDAALTAGALTPPAATEGKAFSNTTVFHFTDADPNGTAGDYAATVQTGDATLTSTANPGNVQVVAHSGGGFDVLLSYTYAEELSNKTFGVSVTDAGGSSTSQSTSTFSVADAPLAATGTAVTPVTGNSFTGVVATFTDADPAGTATDYTATITWGNGKTSAGTIAASGSGFTVSGTNTYAADGVYAIMVTIKDAGGSSATASSTAYVGGLATHLGVTAATAETAGTPFALTVTALDAAGHPAYSYAGTVHFTSTDAKAALPANYPFTAGDLGTHVFSVTLLTAGTQSVTATDTAKSTITGKQAGIVVSPGAVSKFAVVSSAGSVTAGKALSVTVTAQDAYGNTVTGYTGTVHFTSTDPQAVLPANYTFTAKDAGKHTFSVTLKTAGGQTVTVTDTASSTVTGTSGAITVTPAAATHFKISAPASVTHGVAFTFTVTALDAYGNVATGYLGPVAFTSSDSKAKLPANFTFTAGNAGVATFTSTFNTEGVQSLTATDTKTKSITGTDASIQVS